MLEPKLRLSVLYARFLWQVEFSHSWRDDCPSVPQAQGVMFLCPKCYLEKGSAIGVHSVICWFAGRVSDDVTPGPGRWTPSENSTSIENLTFVPGTPPRSTSVKLTGGCGWHGFIVSGEASILKD